MQLAADYEFELWDSSGNIVGNIGRICSNKRYSRERNGVGQCSFTVDLYELDKFVKSIGYSAKEALKPYASDIKIKRNGQYLRDGGYQVVRMDINLNDRATANVQCTSYINLLKDRYITKTYDNVEVTDMVWDMINTTQQQSYGDMGITLGPNQAAVKIRDRTFQRQNIREELMRLTELESGRFDFEFTYNREFNTYEQIGSQRDALQLEYPGNVMSIQVSRDASTLANKIIGLGSGIGDEVISSEQTDAASATEFGLREKIVTFNNVILQSTVDENSIYELRRHRDTLEIPKVTINGVNLDLNVVQIGDILPVRVNGFNIVQNIDDIYRIERIDVAIDDNENEVITLTFDEVDY